jgi:2-dehydro-3-deoxyphosphogluconate aldolase / (4S)-4-hydroxy-2-oxoglutarate aldolase
MELADRLRRYGVVPVVSVQSADMAAPLAAALVSGGLPVAEITFRTPAAAEVIRRLRACGHEILVGAGTVLDVDTARQAIDSGAHFIVSPGLAPAVVAYSLEHGTPVVPGICTPSEIQQALDLGITFVKFFPAEAGGGVDFLKAVAAPYPQVTFMPTGGISLANLPDYLELDPVVACGGSWIASRTMLESGLYQRITESAAAALVAAGRADREATSAS